MKDEIKEIKEILKKCYDLKDEHFDNYISLYQLGVLLDYITNLQEENEKVHKDFNELSERYFFTKSKNEKAREMIRYIAYNSERPLTIIELNKVYNILGGDEE